MGGRRCRRELHPGVAEHLNFFSRGTIEKEAVRVARKYPYIPAMICGTKPGEFFTTGAGPLDCREIVHAVTMRYPGHKSSLETIRSVLAKVFRYCAEAGYHSIAIPYLGCGTGGLDKKEVHRLIQAESEQYLDIEVRIYDFVSRTY